MRKVLVASLLFSATILRADFSYQETTQMTGGALVNALRMLGPFTRKAREPIVSTVLIKGNRMATLGKDTGSVIDLDKETFTEIDFSKKTYSVVTFAEMRQAMERAMAKAQEKQDKGKQKSDAKIDAKISSKATGLSKTVNGVNAKELVVTIETQVTDAKGNSSTMTVINDSWVGDVPGYDQVRAFHKKMAEKLAYTFSPAMSQMAMTQPQLMEGLTVSAKEMDKLDGVPVQTIVKMGGPPEAAESSNSSAPAAKQEKRQEAPPTSIGAAAAGAIIGGFGRNRNKNKQENPEQNSSSSNSLMEMTTDLASFSSAPVDSSKFDPPAGFKQVESNISKQNR